MASHSDSPSLKIKENPEIEVENAYIKLNVERYGGMILSPWFDRPLSVAGRLIVRQDGKIREKMVTVDRDLLVIPNLAIHMNREVNDGYKYNVQKDMLPLFSDKEGKGRFMETVAEAAEVKTEDILGHDVPIKNYSSGMKSRLGFSIATVVSPKILILDEVLSVGDAKFRKKSEKKVLSMFDSGVTVLFVSHSLAQVQRICNKAMILEKGKLIAYGDIDTISEQYEKMTN